MGSKITSLLFGVVLAVGLNSTFAEPPPPPHPTPLPPPSHVDVCNAVPGPAGFCSIQLIKDSCEAAYRALGVCGGFNCEWEQNQCVQSLSVCYNAL